MSRIVPALIATFVTCALPCLAGHATASETNRSSDPVITKTLGIYRYYGEPEYRCRVFSTVCGYIRPVYYARYWSVQYWVRDAAAARPEPPGRLGRYRPGEFDLGSKDATILEQAGNFVRLEAPGNATRWILRPWKE